MKQNAKCIDLDVSHDEYHADTTMIGCSMLKMFIESQRMYRDCYVTKRRPLPPPTDALELGIWVHLALLEPIVWKRDYIFDLPPRSDGEPWNMRKPSHRQERDELKGERPKMLTPQQRSLVESMRDAVLENDDARVLINLPGEVERAYRWEDASGLMLKSKPDKTINDVMPDVKTCIDASPEGFTRAAMRLGYHRTAAFRSDGHFARTGRKARYLFIAVSKKTLDVAVHELTDAEVELGRTENRMYLDRMARCYETGDWSPWWSRGVNRLTYPKYAFKNEWEPEDGDSSEE